MFARHKLVWLTNTGWEAALEAAPPQQRDGILKWHRADWPGVIRRSDADAGETEVCLGIPLPPSVVDGARLRIPIRAARTEIRKKRDPISIGEAAQVAPPVWRKPLGELAELATDEGLSTGVYGSLAMQALTGMEYVTAKSDVDMLFYPDSALQLAAGIKIFRRVQNRLPLDGEIVFPSGDAVAFKEWISVTGSRLATRVLVKQKQLVQLMTTATLLSTLCKEATGRPCER